MPRRLLGGNKKDLPDIQKYAPSADYHVDDFRIEDTSYAREFNPNLIIPHQGTQEGEHETERVGIERLQDAVNNQVVTHDTDAPAHLHHTLALNRMSDRLERFITMQQKFLDDLYKGRTFVDYVYQVSAHIAIELDYKQRKYVFAYSATAITLSGDDGSTVVLTANAWTNISLRRGLHLVANAINDATPAVILFRATDELMALQTGIVGTVQLGTGGNVIGTVNLNAGGNVIGVIRTSTNNGVVAPAVAANTIIKASGGDCICITATVAGTTGFTVFDNPATNAGNILYASAAAVPIGSIFLLQGHANTGITVQNTATGPGLTVFYN